MIVVVGATGRLGRSVITKLSARGAAVRATCRRTSGATSLRAAGHDAVVVDLRQPQTLDAALDGATAILASVQGLTDAAHDAITHIDIDGHKALIDAAVAARIARFVYISVMGAAADHPSPLWRAKAEIERHLAASGLDYKIIRPSPFMDLHAHDLIGRAILSGRPARVLGAGDIKRNFVAVDDVAVVAVTALTAAEHPAAYSKAVIDVGGPDNLTDYEVAEIYAEIADKPARIRTLAPPALTILATLISPLHAGVARLMRVPIELKGYDLTFDASDMHALLGRAPTSLATFARAKAAAGS